MDGLSFFSISSSDWRRADSSACSSADAIDDVDDVLSKSSSSDGGLRVYVGVRLTQGPRSGTKSEFWTLVRVDKVDTSGSMWSQ